MADDLSDILMKPLVDFQAFMTQAIKVPGPLVQGGQASFNQALSGLQATANKMHATFVKAVESLPLTKPQIFPVPQVMQGVVKGGEIYGEGRTSSGHEDVRTMIF